MIEAKELRIGNYLKWRVNDTCKMKVVSDSVVVIETNATTLRTPFKDLEPILLTEEWLLSFGFIEKDKWFYKEKFLLGYLTSDNLQAEFKFGGFEGQWNIISFKYVHQLQNLYFDLTGEELEIN